MPSVACKVRCKAFGAVLLLSNLADTTPCPMPTWLTQGHFLRHWFEFKQHWLVPGCSTLEFFIAVSRPPHATVQATNDMTLKTDKEIMMKKQIRMNRNMKLKIPVTMNVKKQMTKMNMRMRPPTVFFAVGAQGMQIPCLPNEVVDSRQHTCRLARGACYFLNQRHGPPTDFI